MKTVIYTDKNERFLNEWRRLWNASPHATVVNSPQWFLSSLDAFSWRTYRIMGIYRHGTLAGVVALIKQKYYGIDFYTLPSGNFAYGNPILADLSDPELMVHMWKTLRRWGNIWFDNVPENFVHRTEKYTDPCTFPTSLNYFLPLERNRNGQIQLKDRKELLRRVKSNMDTFKLKSHGGLNTHALESVFMIDSHSSKNRRGYSTFSDAVFRVFYRDLAYYFKNHFLIHLLYYDNTPIAYSIGFVLHNTYIASQLAYHAAYKHMTPGKTIAVYIADDLGKMNMSLMDLGTGENHMKHLLTDQNRILYTVIISHTPLIGRYVRFVNTVKTYVYKNVASHISLYTGYRRIKNAISNI